ncbi:MAG: 30S ribosomal protein S6 [bacterium]
MDKYETLFIAKPDQTDEQIQGILDRLTNRVERQNGKVAEINHWGHRPLAYAVNYRGERLLRGYYVLLTYLGDGSVVTEVERNIKILDATFRYLSVKVEENVDAAAVTETVVKHAEKPAEVEEAEALFEEPSPEPVPEEAGESGPATEEAEAEPPAGPEAPAEPPESEEEAPEPEAGVLDEQASASPEEEPPAEPEAETTPSEKE